MLLLNYDFYDLYATVVLLRQFPLADYNAEIVKNIQAVIGAPQVDNTIQPNRIRQRLRTISSLDSKVWYWVYVDNVYTYGIRAVKEEYAYKLIWETMAEFLLCLERNETERFYDLADAFHNVPALLADGCAKKSIFSQVSAYRQKWNPVFGSSR